MPSLRPAVRTLAGVALLVGSLVVTGAFAVLLDRVEPPPPAPTSPPPSADAAVLVGAGDIASCISDGDERTAALLDRIPGIVFTLGDTVYESGTAGQFRDCYEPSWGRHRYRTRPVIGNHDNATANGGPFFAYFGASAGEPGQGFYAYDHAGWRVLVLNSNCGSDGCGDASQLAWLGRELAAHPARCSVAMFHHPRFSSGLHGDDERMDALWRALVAGGVDLVLNGHDHHYQRYAPLGADGTRDADGMRAFIVGTGGRNLYPFNGTDPRVEVRDNRTFGVLRLDLRDGGYGWTFVPVAGETFTDSGSATCR